MSETSSVLTGTTGLWLLLAVAGGLTASSPRIAPEIAVRASWLRVCGATIAVQAAHAAEELITGFYERFPAVLGLAPWSARFFAV